MPSFPHKKTVKNVKKGVGFTIMVVGATGTGKTTFINTLLGQRNWIPHEEHDDASAAILGAQDIKIRKKTIDFGEDDVHLRLTVCDAPGFGDTLIDNEESFSVILEYLEKQYDDMLAEETRIKRSMRFEDQRVHALLYFIPPTGHSLREIDIELMRRLSPRVNVIPCIGKADSLTPGELQGFKQRIMEDIEHYNIPIYDFPFDPDEDDDETIAESSDLRARLPFAVVGSEDFVEVEGELIRARKYPWGVVEVDNPAHSDFRSLRNALLNGYYDDLKEITIDRLYENYRTQVLSRNDLGDPIDVAQTLGPADMSAQALELKESQIRQDRERLKAMELKMQRELSEKRQELMALEANLRSMEARAKRG